MHNSRVRQLSLPSYVQAHRVEAKPVGLLESSENAGGFGLVIPSSRGVASHTE